MTDFKFQGLPFLFYVVCYFALLWLFCRRSLPFKLKNEDGPLISLRMAYYYVLMLCGLILDNIRIGLGWAMGEGVFLEGITLLCFLFHAVLTPFFINVVWSMLARCGMAAQYQRRPTKAPKALEFCLKNYMALSASFTVISVGFGVFGIIHFSSEIAGNLKLGVSQGLIKYSVDSKPYELIAIILSNLLGIFSGILIWKWLDWSWVFWMQLIVLVGSGVGPVNKTFFFFSSNFFEVIYMASFVLTEYRLVKLYTTDAQSLMSPVSAPRE